MTDPPFAYYGGKIGLAPLIVRMLPPHRVYLEPFFGSGAVLFRKRPAAIEVVNDVDRNVVTFFKVLRERPDELELACRLSPYARDEYLDADLDAEDLDDLERARRFWIRVNQSFGKALGWTGFSITTARSSSPARSAWTRIARFAGAVERLQQVMVEHCDGADLIERLATPDSAIYVDPPYLGSTRRQGRRSKASRSGPGARSTDYACDMSEPEDHERLAKVLRATPAAVVLSGYPSPLYDELYGGWARLEVPVRVHSSNAVTSERGDRVEVLWTNRPVELGQLPFAAAHA